MLAPNVALNSVRQYADNNLNTRKCDTSGLHGKQTFAATRLHPLFLSAYPIIHF